MGLGRRTGRRTALVAVSVAGCLLAGITAGPVLAAEATSTTVPGATIVTVVPAPQTKILQVDPVATMTTTAPSKGSPAPAETAATVSADSPALRALVDVTTAGQRQLGAEVSRSEADVAALRAAFDAAQAGLSARQGDEQTAQAAVDTAQAGVAGAESRLGAVALAAASAAEAVGNHRTPVASPPSPGHTPRDAAAQARAELVAATADRDRRRVALADRQRDLDTAQQARAAAADAFTARADDLQHGLDALDQTRRQLTGGAGGTADGTVALRPAPTALATATIPAAYLALYGQAAATCDGLSWLVLAGIGSVESAHGQSAAAGVRAGANVAGAMGPMQFLAGTWAAYGTDGDGDGVRDVYDPADAIFGAANYLCASGAGDVNTLRRALFAYNHADWYVEEVLQVAARY